LDALTLLVGVRRLVALPGVASRGLLLVSGGVKIASGGVNFKSPPLVGVLRLDALLTRIDSEDVANTHK
jgi:hypothetical protein